MSAAETSCWYERRNELGAGQVFRTHGEGVVKLDRPVPADGTDWYVANWDARHKNWAFYDARIHPGDLAELLPKDWNGESA